MPHHVIAKAPSSSKQCISVIFLSSVFYIKDSSYTKQQHSLLRFFKFSSVEFVMKYILVHWSATNNTIVLTVEFVRDKSMLNDPEKKGMIRYGTIGDKPPTGGWKAYLGPVIFVNGE
jgi:competence transcription factor ComK